MTSNDEKNWQISIEKSMKKLQYESFDDWVKNFALNLNDIWSDPSAHNLIPSANAENKTYKNTGIVIGKGPSLIKNHHLKLLSESNFQGSIICTDGILKTALENGVTPDKFPKFYVVTIDPYPFAKQFYDNEIVQNYGKKITGVFSTIIDHNVVSSAKFAGIKVHWLHPLLDFNEGKKSFNQISALMVRAKNHPNGLPAIQTGANVGTSAWFVGWRILKCNVLGLIGINHGWNEDDPWEKIISHGRSIDPERKHEQVHIDKNNPNFKLLFKKIFNPEFNCTCIVDPLFQFYSGALKEFILRSPQWLSTINATEGGSIFGERIQCMTFKRFLEIYNS